jgi:hypothetical protein
MRGTPQPNESAELEQRLLQEEQEDLAGVDTSIRQSVEAIQIGRDAVVERMHPDSPGTTDPAQVVNAGREQVMQNLRTTAKSLGEQRAPVMNEQLTQLTDDLAGRVRALASQAGRADAIGRRILETQIRSAVATYLVSVGKVLNPLHFEAASVDRQPNEGREES